MFHNEHNNYTKKSARIRNAVGAAFGCIAVYAIIFVDTDIEGIQKVRLTTAKHRKKSDNGCNDFFGTLAPWVTEGDKSCDKIFTNDTYNRLMVLNSKMEEFNTYYTIYINFSEEQIENVLCYDEILRTELNLNRIKIEDYYPEQLLMKYGFDKDDITRVQAINGAQGKSDVMRLALAAEYRQTYIDTDIAIMSGNYEDFMKPFVVLEVWGESSASLEITNAVFCLSKEVLTMTLDRVKEIMIDHGDREYYDQELGASLFQRAVTNHAEHPVNMYAVNHPHNSSPQSISSSRNTYEFKLIHLTPDIRSKEPCFITQVNKIRKAMDLEDLDLMPLSNSNLTFVAADHLL